MGLPKLEENSWIPPAPPYLQKLFETPCTLTPNQAGTGYTWTYGGGNHSCYLGPLSGGCPGYSSGVTLQYPAYYEGKYTGPRKLPLNVNITVYDGQYTGAFIYPYASEAAAEGTARDAARAKAWEIGECGQFTATAVGK